MCGTQTPGSHARRQRERVIIQRLALRFRRAETDDVNAVNGEEGGSEPDGEFTWEKEGMATSSVQINGEDEAEHIDLGVVKIWLDELCHEEQRTATSQISRSRERSTYKRYKKLAAQLRSTESGMDTTILERIKGGYGPRDVIVEDLVAPLRTQALPPDTHESYEEMKQVLLTRNKQISSRRFGETVSTLQDLTTALKWRLRAAERVLSIVSDDTDPEQWNESAQNGILEPSRHRLLDAIHAYWPETRAFRNQDAFDLLVAMLAHVCVEEGGGGCSEEANWMYLSCKVLVWENLLQHRFAHEKKRRGFEKRKQKAIREGDQMELVGCIKEQKGYSEKIAEKARRDALAKINYARGELRRKALDDLLALTIRQSAQQSAYTHLQLRDSASALTSLLDDHSTTGILLDNRIQKCFPGLESTVDLTSTSLDEIIAIHDTVLMPTLKFSGVDVVETSEIGKEEEFKAGLGDPVTANLMQKTSLGVVETREVAREVARQLGGVERGLEALHEAAEERNGELEKLAGLVCCCDEAPLHGDVVIEKSMEKAGPVRLS